jgi:Uncharacterised nucleotidyltransferase
MPVTEEIEPLIRTLKGVAAGLQRAGIPFALAGSFAVYARGGAAYDHDVDFLIRERDVDPALTALVETGLRAERPPEDWLVKVYEEDRLVDLIFRPVQRPVTDEMLADSDVLAVHACHMPVLSATELMIHKVLSFGPHYCDLTRALPVARSVREQIDWARVQRESAHSPYAQAFLTLVDRLGIFSPAQLATADRRTRLKEVIG